MVEITAGCRAISTQERESKEALYCQKTGFLAVRYDVFELESQAQKTLCLAQGGSEAHDAVFGVCRRVFQACDDQTSSKFERQEPADCFEIFYQEERKAQVDLRG